MTLRQFNMYFWTFFFWGASFLWLAIAIPEYGWVGAVSIRSFIASAALVLIAFVSGRKLKFDAKPQRFALLAFFSVACNLGGMSFAIIHLGTSLTAILVCTIPLYSLLIESIWHKRLPTPVMVVGLLLGFSGVVILIGFTPQAVNAHFWLGMLGSTIASVGFAMGGSYANMKLPKVGSWERTIGNFFFGGLLTLPLFLIAPMPVIPPSLKATAALITVAVTASSLAYVLYFKLVDEIGPTKALTTEFMVPVVAVIIGYLLLDETMTMNQLLGATIIITGCALVMGFVPKRFKKSDELHVTDLEVG